jgi:hypothetical protein
MLHSQLNKECVELNHLYKVKKNKLNYQLKIFFAYDK